MQEQRAREASPQVIVRLIRHGVHCQAAGNLSANCSLVISGAQPAVPSHAGIIRHIGSYGEFHPLSEAKFRYTSQDVNRLSAH
jgi:hypothetical protein